MSAQRARGDVSLARRLPGFDARHATKRARRWRGTAVLIVVLLVATGAAIYLVKALGGSKTSSSSSTTVVSGTTSPKVTVTVATPTAQLNSPVSSEVVLPGAGAQLVVMGGATTGGTTASGVFTFDTTSGELTLAGQLSTGLADACGALIAGQDVVVGGRSPPVVATVQQMPQPGPNLPFATANVVGALPQPRADAATTTIGPTTYLVGGDDGTKLLSQVLSTTDGRTWAPVANLVQPVRFAAAAATGTTLYVFGGESISSTAPATPFDTIQALDLATHRVRIVGHLPEPLFQASALTIGNRIFIIGGTAVLGSPSPPHGSGSSATTSASPPTPVTVPTIWSFDAANAKLTEVGRLSVPVAQAGIAVLGQTAWVIGGESNGTAVSAVQTVTVKAAPAPAPGSGRH